MVAVAHHEIAEVTLVPLVEIAGIVMGRLFLTPHVESLVHHKQSHLVAQIKHLRRRRIVRAPYGIAPHIFHHLQLTLHSPAVERRAKASMVVMQAHAVDFHVSPIKEKSFFRIESDCAESYPHSVAVYHIAGMIYVCHKTIEIRGSGIPQMRIADRQHSA